jgi:hypothetical protein
LLNQQTSAEANTEAAFSRSTEASNAHGCSKNFSLSEERLKV